MPVGSHRFYVIGSLLFGYSLECQESVDTSEARLSLEGVELKEEWQDEDFPRYYCLLCILWIDYKYEYGQMI